MDKSIIPHVFASLLSLERTVGNVERLAKADSTENAKSALALIPAQRKVLESMRRAANSLQLQLAAGDTLGTIRSLKIFYGLNHMVRPELSSAMVLLAAPAGMTISNRTKANSGTAARAVH